MLLNLIKKLTKKILYNKATHICNQKYITYKKNFYINLYHGA